MCGECHEPDGVGGELYDDAIERDMLADFAAKHNVGEGEHRRAVAGLGWTMQEFERGVKDALVQRRGSHHQSISSAYSSGGVPPKPAGDSEAGRAVAEALREQSRVERAIDKTF